MSKKAVQPVEMEELPATKERKEPERRLKPEEESAEVLDRMVHAREKAIPLDALIDAQVSTTPR